MKGKGKLMETIGNRRFAGRKGSSDIEDYHHINAGSRPGITAQILHYSNIGNRQFQAKKDRRGASWFAA